MCGLTLARARTVSLLWLFEFPPQTEVEVPTSYADSGVYSFTRVFPAHTPTSDVYHAVLPIVIDCASGVSGAVLVSGTCGARVCCCSMFSFVVYLVFAARACSHRLDNVTC